SAVTGLLALMQFYKKQRSNLKYRTLSQAVDKAKKEIESGKYLEAFNTSLRASMIAQNLYPEVKADLTEFRKQLSQGK
ncbi:unnamed protein product, partial [marine sediment metagenome]